MNLKRGMNSIIKFGICLGLCVMLSGCGDDSGFLKTQIKTLQAQVANLQEQVKDRQTRIENLRAQVEDRQTQIENLRAQIESLQTQIKEITAQRDAAQKNAVRSDKKNTMLWWSIPLLLVGALGYGTVMGLKSRADVKKRAKNNENA